MATMIGLTYAKGSNGTFYLNADRIILIEPSESDSGSDILLEGSSAVLPVKQDAGLITILIRDAEQEKRHQQ